MKYVRLIASDQGATGEIGLIVKGTPESEGLLVDIDGTLIAHDVLEHVNGHAAIGAADDELMAIGAIWQVRGRHGDLARGSAFFGDAAESVASDIHSVALDMSTGTWKPRIGQYRTMSHLHDEDFTDILDKARHSILREICDTDGDMADFPLAAFLENAMHLMRIGFRKAERKYRDDGYDMFVGIRETVGAIKPEWAGQEYILAYDRSRNASVRELRYWEYK